ncbi:tryptophan 5 hydroxylase 1 [Trichuris trichiura]|uniref:Tryptophan 5 hydroxylase 1 n=1 Tax=Trichuris trichiura TaxID=36087 RepID=A0A077ZAC6_TRITR|nr:tryptophan 5 hydroxylase 1 [Trichuris trichiura]
MDVPLAQLQPFPAKRQDLDYTAKRVLLYGKDLDADHPGFKDEKYRKRRVEISQLSEQFTWSVLFERLKILFSEHACSAYLENFHLLEKEGLFQPERIPQLEDVSKFLKSVSSRFVMPYALAKMILILGRTGFELYPVAGYLSPKDFLNGLAFRVFHATQYIRHPTDPFYSPEPDVCHELLGHAAMFASPEFAQFSQEIGLASLDATEEEVNNLAKLYFFTVEFGICTQNGQRKAYGAGLLSSVSELTHAMQGSPKLLPLSVEGILEAECIISAFQNAYFVCDDFREAISVLRTFINSLSRRRTLYYDVRKDRIIVSEPTSACCKGHFQES